MATPKKSPLSVSLDLPLIPSHRRKAEIVTTKTGYSFVRYSGEVEEVELTAETETDLLRLVKPFEKETDPVALRFSPWRLPEIDPKLLEKFLNTWGMIGFRNEAKFINLANSRTDLVIASSLGYPMGMKEASKFIGKDIGERYTEIRHLNEIPLPWIEDELRTLAFCVRLTNNLFRDQGNSEDFKREEIFMSEGNRMRIVSSSANFASLDFKDNQDPATDRKKAANLDRAEEVLDQFAGEINRYLRPLTISVMRTEKTESFYFKNLAFETALATAIAKRFRVGGVLLICKECENPYFPQRLREDAKYCSYSCSQRVRNREYKAREREKKKKNSAIKADSKIKQSKVRKEKNGKE
jgi:hypothetical protein